MKKYLLFSFVLMSILCFSCSPDEEPSEGNKNETSSETGTEDNSSDTGSGSNNGNNGDSQTGGNTNNDIDKKPGEAIDLGLPSGIKWASCNVGATKPEDYGCYYAWGETVTKNSYSLKTYKYRSKYNAYLSIGNKISGTTYDVARVKWGGKWRLPTTTEIYELCDYCTWEKTKRNGIDGQKVTSKKNGASIFLPAAGYRYEEDLREVCLTGRYWGGELTGSFGGNTCGCSLYFYSYHCWDYTSREEGVTVRPVQ